MVKCEDDKKRWRRKGSREEEREEKKDVRDCEDFARVQYEEKKSYCLWLGFTEVGRRSRGKKSIND